MGGILPPDLKIYEIITTITGEKSYQGATNAQDACLQAGWQIGDCYDHPLEPQLRTSPDQGTELRVKIPCHSCPYHYSDCTKGENDPCPVKPQAPELNEWMKQATRSHLCPYQGNALSKKDHQLGQKWVTMEQAIKELAPQHLQDAANPR